MPSFDEEVPIVVVQSVAQEWGACANLAFCDLAKNNKTLEWYEGPGEYCPECGERLARRGSVAASLEHRRWVEEQAQLLRRSDWALPFRLRAVIVLGTSAVCVVCLTWVACVVTLAVLGVVVLLSVDYTSHPAESAFKKKSRERLREPVPGWSD